MPDKKTRAINQVPLNSRLLLLGDSITRMGLYEDNQILHPPAVSISSTNVGYGNVANILSGSCFFIPLHGNQGVNGDNVAGVLSRVLTVVELKPAVVLLLAGINSIFHNISEKSITEDYRSICDRLIAAGAVVVAVTILPQFEGLFPPLTRAQEKIRKNVNSYILSRTDIYPIDVESYLNDPSYFLDGLHPNSIGVYRVATKVAPVLASLIVPGKVQDLIGTSISFIPNTLLTGTNGRLTNASGIVADHWELSADDAGGANVTASKSERDDKQLILISGEYSGVIKQAILSCKTVTWLNINDVVEGFLEIEILEPSIKISTINLMVEGYNRDNSQLVMHGEAYYISEHSPLQLPVGTYLFRTPPQKLAHPVINLVTSVNIFFMDASSLSKISGYFKVHHCSVRKIDGEISSIDRV